MARLLTRTDWIQKLTSPRTRRDMKLRSADWIWKSFVAGLCGSLAHTLLMWFKARTGLLPSFQPYQALQSALSHLIGSPVSPLVTWLISYVNGAAFFGLLFGRLFRLLPGRSGAMRGIVIGIFGWLIMGSVFFPLVGLGFFATALEIGIAPAVFSLAMMLTYSVVMGVVYAALSQEPPAQV